MKNRPKYKFIENKDKSKEATYYYSRLIEHVENKEITRAVVVFEIIQSVFSTFDSEDKDAAEKFIASLPIKHWRENTLPVPADILKVLAESWTHYKDNNGAYSFSQVLGIDGKGQGKKGTLKRLKKLNRDVNLTRQVWMERRDDEECSRSKAYVIVADRNNLEERTVRNAFLEHEKRFFKSLNT